MDLWTRIIAARDGASVAPAARRSIEVAFTRPVVRFAVVGGHEPRAFALTLVKDGRIALLSRLCVDPTAASRGIGTALVTDAVDHARAAGFSRIDLDVRETNARAIALYGRAGFVAVSEPWTYDRGDLMVTLSLGLAGED